MSRYTYTIPGPAVAQGRPRLTTWGGRAHAYEPQKSRDYKAFVRQCATEQGVPDKPLSCPVILRVTEYRPIPQSWSKRKQQAADAGEILPARKPDWDNVGKAISDALNGLVWEDDAQVVTGSVSKLYDRTPRVFVEVWTQDKTSDSNNIVQESDRGHQKRAKGGR